MPYQHASCGSSKKHDTDKQASVLVGSDEESNKSDKFIGMNAAFALVFAELNSDLQRSPKLSLKQYEEHSANLKSVQAESTAQIAEIKGELLNRPDPALKSSYLESYGDTVRHNERATLFLEKNLFQ